MSILPVLEVAISLALLYLFFSQVVSSLFELFAGKLNVRGKYLRRYLNHALNSGNDKNWAELVYRHPSVDMLAQKASRPPTYIPSSVFVKAIVDLVTDEARKHTFTTNTTTGDTVYQVEEPAGSPLQQFRAGLERVSQGDFKMLVQTLLLNAEGCQPGSDDTKIFEEFVHGLAVWYDGYMERVSGWYKRHVRGYLFLVGLLVAVVCNLDSLRVSSYLWTNTAARQRIVAYASTQAADSATLRRMLLRGAADSTTKSTNAALKKYAHRVDSLTLALRDLGFPIGWSLSAPDSAQPVDSTKLPAMFLTLVPTRQVQLPASTAPKLAGTELSKTERATNAAVAPDAQATTNISQPETVRWQQPAHYVRYEKSQQNRVVNGLALSRVIWRKSILSYQAVQKEATLKKAIWPRPGPSLTWWQKLKQSLAFAGRQANSWSIVGWLITAAALSFGAPFWFELLNRLVNMRNVGLRPPTATPTAAKDPS